MYRGWGRRVIHWRMVDWFRFMIGWLRRMIWFRFMISFRWVRGGRLQNSKQSVGLLRSMRWLITGIHWWWLIISLHGHAVVMVMVIIMSWGFVSSLHGHTVMGMMVVTHLMTLMESGQDIARPQRLQFEGIIDRSLGLAVGGRLVVDVNIVLGKVVIGVRNHVIRLRLLVSWLRLLVNWFRLLVNWPRLLVNWFRLLINRVGLLVRVGRWLIVVIRRRQHAIARGGSCRV